MRKTQKFKQCTQCKRVKSINNYHANKTSLGGKVSVCRSCKSSNYKSKEKLRKKSIDEAEKMRIIEVMKVPIKATATMEHYFFGGRAR